MLKLDEANPRLKGIDTVRRTYWLFFLKVHLKINCWYYLVTFAWIAKCIGDGRHI